MTTINDITEKKASRRGFLTGLAIAGVSSVAATALVGCGGGNSSSHAASVDSNQSILNAAATAEALATVMYYNIINATGSIYSTGALAANAPDKAYLVAGYEEELNHYNFLVAAGAKPLASTFYFPTNMFVDPQTTMNTLVTLEDAFIAAYLIGVRDFTSTTLKVYAAQIMGVEAEHRTLARVLTNDLGLTAVSGLAGSEAVTAPTGTANNLAFERTFSSALPNIAAVVTALGPFVTAGATGYAATAYPFATASAGMPSAGQSAVTLAETTP